MLESSSAKLEPTEHRGIAMVGLTESDEIAIEMGDISLAATLTPREMRELSRLLICSAKRIEKRQRGSNV